ncbi:hypothetical protein [uncultured Maribacter sp.]|uniref:hypothetical protein n=1 Tax=uncultured Maribacter sp. TaxID=431308 RepID=UPI00260A3025|nr:hypothetical protein [uncultured Maribacter sp.]
MRSDVKIRELNRLLKRRLNSAIKRSIDHSIVNDQKNISSRILVACLKKSQKNALFHSKNIQKELGWSNAMMQNYIGNYFKRNLNASFSNPYDWVLGKDGKYVWDENVTSATDKDLNGREYIGPKKYDAYKHAWKNRNPWEKLWNLGPKNVNWNSYYTPLLKSYSLKLIERQKNRKIIPLSPSDLEFNKRNRYSQDKLSPTVESFTSIELRNTPRLRNSLDAGSVQFQFNISVDGKLIPAIGSYARMHSHQEYINKFSYGSSEYRTVMDRFDNFSILFGNNKYRKDIFVITFKDKDDYYAVQNYIGFNY